MRSIGSAELGRLFDAFGPALVLYARQWLEAPEAEDVVQDAFLRLICLSRPPRRPKGWLFRCVRNAALNRARSRRRRRRHERRLAGTRPAWFEPRPDVWVDAQAAQEAVRSLPQAQREVLMLRIWGQMTLQETAEVVRRPVSTVYAQYRAALAALRKTMEMPCRTKAH